MVSKYNNVFFSFNVNNTSSILYNQIPYDGLVCFVNNNYVSSKNKMNELLFRISTAT